MAVARGDKRIAVVGAGASGLATAHFLRRRGYRYVTVFERDERPGGKCCSVDVDGRGYDMGAVSIFLGYREVLRLARAYGVRIVSSSGSRKLFPWPRLRARDIPALLKCGRLLLRYRAAGAPDFARLPAELDVSIDEFFRDHGLGEQRDLLTADFTGSGYSLPEVTPVAYLLKFLLLIFPADLRGWLRLLHDGSRLRVRPGENAFMISPRGFQRLFEAVAPHFDIRYGTPVVGLERDADGILLKTSASSAAPVAPERFDRVILATNPGHIRGLFGPDDPVQSLFDMVRTVDYYVGLFRPRAPVPRNQPLPYFYPDRGRLCYLYQMHLDAEVYTAGITTDPGADIASVRAALTADMRSFGLGEGDWIAERRWHDYFPHVEPADFHAYHRGLDERQGRDGVYFAGESGGMPCVEGVVRFARQLVETHF